MAKSNRSGWWKAVVVIVLVVALVFLQQWSVSQEYVNAEQEATGFVQDLTDGINPGALYGVTASLFQESTDQVTWAKCLSENTILYNMESIEFDYKEMTREDIGKTMSLAGTIYATDGTSELIYFGLLKEDGEWKILNLMLNAQEDTEGVEAEETEA